MVAPRWDAVTPWVAPDAAPDYTVLLVFEGPHLARFVLARHRERGWELPGGRVEVGESLDEAARREWAEETGLRLADLVPLLLHERPDGSRGHIFVGRTVGPVDGATGVDAVPRAGEKVVAVRAASALADVAPLAFPDDPYAEVAAAVWEAADALGFERVRGEDRGGFVARLSVHPEAPPKGHRVVAHPARGGPST